MSDMRAALCNYQGFLSDAQVVEDDHSPIVLFIPKVEAAFLFI